MINWLIEFDLLYMVEKTKMAFKNILTHKNNSIYQT